MQYNPLFNRDCNAENGLQTDGALGSHLRADSIAINLNPVRPSISTIQIGTKTLFCCGFDGCQGVFNSRVVRYLHQIWHRKGFQDVRSKLKLTEDGRVFNSVERCYVNE